MGGRGSSYTEPSKSVSELEEIFKSAEEEVFDTRIRNLFTSFSESDREYVSVLKEQVKRTPFGFRFDDCSDLTNNEASCVERITGSAVLLCFIGELTHEDNSVSWQLEEATKIEKKIIGIILFPKHKHKIPEIIVDRRYSVIEWDPARLSKLLDDA